MRIVFDGELNVHYRFGFIQSADDPGGDLPSTWSGQVNGLLGAAEPGILSFITGQHTGDVPMRVELCDAEPPLDAEWEDVVEASFTAPDHPLAITTFDHAVDVDIPAGTYRVRFHAHGMDAATDGVRRSGEPVLDRYLIRLWPAASTGPDVILREGSACAASWHRSARKQTVE